MSGRILFACAAALLVSACDGAPPPPRRAPAMSSEDLAGQQPPTTSTVAADVAEAPAPVAPVSFEGLWRPPRLLPPVASDGGAGVEVYAVDGVVRTQDWLEAVARAVPGAQIRAMAVDADRRRAWLEALVERELLALAGREAELDHAPELAWVRLELLAKHGLRAELDARAEAYAGEGITEEVRSIQAELERPEHRQGLRVRVVGKAEGASVRAEIGAITDVRAREAELRRRALGGAGIEEALVDSKELSGVLRDALFSTSMLEISAPVRDAEGAWWLVMPVRIQPELRYPVERIEPYVRADRAWSELDAMVASTDSLSDVNAAGWSLNAEPDVVLLESSGGVAITGAMLEARPAYGGVEESKLKAELSKLVALAEKGRAAGVGADPLFVDAWNHALAQAVRSTWERPKPVEEADIVARFEAEREQYGRPERRRLFAVYFREEAAAKAARAELVAVGPSGLSSHLRELYRRESRERSDAGGVLPYVSLSGDVELDVPKPVREAGFALERKELSPVIEVGDGRWALVAVEAVREGVAPNFEEARPYIARALRDERSKAVRDAAISEIRAKHSVTVHEDALTGVRLPPLRWHGTH